MRFILNVTVVIFAFGLSACVSMDRDPRSGYAADSGSPATSDFYHDRMSKEESEAAEELGINSGPMSEADHSRLEQRLRLRRMEAGLESKRDKKQYYSARNLMHDDQERMAFLSLPDFATRQRWLKNRGLLNEEEAYPENIAKEIEANDISLGMSQKAVRQSWGDPDLVETAGDPMYGYERWNYHRMIAGGDGYQKELRTVYFEGGRVVGWEHD